MRKAKITKQKKGSDKFKLVFSGGAFVLVVLHLVWPKLAIDPVTIALIVLVILPWLGPIIKGLASSGVKNVELPGGIKIELADIKSATDKVIGGRANITLPMLQLRATGSVSEPKDIEVEQKIAADPLAYIQEVASADSNLSLVAFRIEIEKRLRLLAKFASVNTEKIALNQLIRMLQDKKILSPPMASGLMELIGFGNRAAHGVEVSKEASAWVLDIGPSIIMELDAIIFKLSAHNNSAKLDPH